MITEKELLTLCGQVGRVLLTSGAETSRVETTVEYIGKAAGFTVTCHATMTAILISEDLNNRVHIVKIRGNQFNLQKLDEINHLSRQFTEGRLSFTELQGEVNRIDQKVIDFKWPEKILSAGLVSVAPMMLFKASWSDLAWAFLVGICGYLIAQWAFYKVQGAYAAPALGGLTVGFLAGLLFALHLGQNADHIAVSALMPLVPGVAMTNSFREIIGRDTISGLVRAVDAVVTAGAIGGGVIIGHFLAQLLTL